MKITFLKPEGLTFTSIAYGILARKFNTPSSTGEGVQLVLADNNESVLPTLLTHRQYGAMAMETKAEQRIDSPTNSFIDLLKSFDHRTCPIQVIGALRMKIHFALMARRGVSLSEIRKIVGHRKSIGACRRNIEKLGVLAEEVGSNGLGAELVAHDKRYALSGALAPVEASAMLGLEVLHSAFEDREAVTTFYLLGPRAHRTSADIPTRAFVVFRLAHTPGTLVHALFPFRTARINLRMIHSLPMQDEEGYDFAVELEWAPENKLFLEAFEVARRHMERHILFGPFPIISF